MENPHKFLEDDKHLCIKCKRTIIGLDSYVIHRKTHCQESSGTSACLAHVSRDCGDDHFDINAKSHIEQNDVSESFSNGVIDLSTSTKRNLSDDSHSSLLFPSVLGTHGEHKSSKLCKEYNSGESYTETYGDADSCQHPFVRNKDQSLYVEYKSTISEQIKKELLVAAQQQYNQVINPSSDIFQGEPSSISLFRTFDSFTESFKGNQEMYNNSYFPQSGNKYITESNNYDNKFTEIYQGNDTGNFLSNDNSAGTKNDHFKSKLLENTEITANEFSKTHCYDEEMQKNKIQNSELPDCSAKGSCTDDVLDFSKQEDIRQNDFLSSLELTSNVGKKIKYESDIEDEDDYDESRPPSHYTGGKWPPGTHPHPRETGKWMFSPRSIVEDSRDGFDELNDNIIDHHHSYHPPPPSYTKGKWLPGKRMIDVSYERNEEYECKCCKRTLKGKTAFEKHLRSELHFKNDNKSSTVKQTEPHKRPIRAKKEKAQIFLKQKISLMKRQRKKAIVETPEKKNSDIDDTRIPSSKLLCAEIETDEEIETKCSKMLCPICRLSFSDMYSSQHFASLAHIHNELEYNAKPNVEISKSYNKIILSNIELLIRSSYFFCKPCKFYTNSHDDLEYHVGIFHDDENNSTEIRTVYLCSACPDETGLYAKSDLLRHLKVSQHKRNVYYEILQTRQVALSYFMEIVCQICDQRFRYNKAYRTHRRIFHEEKTFQLVNQRLSHCSECSFQSTTERQIRIHLRKIHNINCSTYYFCFVCGIRFDTSTKADSHRHSTEHRIIVEMQKGKSNSRTCNICYSTLDNLTILRQHMIEQHQKELTPCAYCGIIFPLRADLTVHRKTCSKVVVVLEGLYKCDLCSFSNDLLAHVLMHTLLVHYEKEETELYSCHICKASMQCRSIKNHMLLHTKEHRYSCSHCSRKFLQEDWLNSHLSVVHSSSSRSRNTEDGGKCIVKNTEEGLGHGSNTEEGLGHGSNSGMVKEKGHKKNLRVLCEICGRTYRSRSHLKRHQDELHIEGVISIETKHRPMKSKICDQKEFSSFKSLVCEVCGIVCGNPAELKTHRYKHKNCGEKGNSYPCPHCSYSTPRMHHLRRHLRLHTGATPFKCPYCSYAANNQENLRKHMIKTQRHSGRYMYECQLCQQNNSAEKVPRRENGAEHHFGTNLATAFKEHLISRHKTHFKDKEEVMSHIRSYYQSDNDSTYTDNPKLFKYQLKKRQRKCHVNTEETIEEDGLISNEIKLPSQQHPLIDMDFEKQIPASFESSSKISHSQGLMSLGDMPVVNTSFGQDKLSNIQFPSCSFSNDILPTSDQNQRKNIRLFINKETKKAYILKNENDTSYLHLPQSNLDIPIGSEVIFNSSEGTYDSKVDSGNQLLGSVNQTEGLCDGASWVQETKIQNVVAKKVYLLLSNGKNIENQIQDILPSLQ